MLYIEHHKGMYEVERTQSSGNNDSIDSELSN